MPIAFLYDSKSYQEIREGPTSAGAGNTAPSLAGIQVASKGFLDALISHCEDRDLVAVVIDPADADGLIQYFRDHPAARQGNRRLRVVNGRDFHQTFLARPPAPLLFAPCPPPPGFAWARHHAATGAFALSGITHSLVGLDTARLLGELVTAPFETYDSLICNSRAALAVVRTITGVYADYLRDRFGGNPALRPRLAQIPLGVNTDQFHPPSPEERRAQRRRLNIADDEVAALFVGRMSWHAKAHPFPMYQGLARAAKATGRKIHLIISGWTGHDALRHAFLESAAVVAPDIRLTALDGTNPEFRFGVWHAADFFTSLSDSFETFGLVLIEAMACGLPVVASDWNGYRDIVEDGISGFLVPTMMMGDSTRNATSRLLSGETTDDQFQAECNQTIVVDVGLTATAYARLIRDADLRHSMGLACRRRVLELFTWPKIIKAYETLWREQEKERLASQGTSPHDNRSSPARYPAPEISFAGHPGEILHGDSQVCAVLEQTPYLERLLDLPSINYMDQRRSTDCRLLHAILVAAQTPCHIADLDALLERAGLAPGIGRATLSWLMKYGFLRKVISHYENN